MALYLSDRVLHVRQGQPGRTADILQKAHKRMLSLHLAGYYVCIHPPRHSVGAHLCPRRTTIVEQGILVMSCGALLSDQGC